MDNYAAIHHHTSGRLLQALTIAKGNPVGALAFVESQVRWDDQRQLIGCLKSAISAGGTADFSERNPASESFLGAMRSYSVPLQLTGLKVVPMFTRLYINSAGVVATRVDQGSGLPVLRGNWEATTLEPLKHGGIVVTTDELARSLSGTAALSMQDDLAQATAEAENLSFVSPDHAGSVLYGVPNFAGTGTAVANIDADLKRLIDLVPGAWRPGAAFVMTVETATFLSLVRGSGGAASYPGITPQGGTLLGLPVLITTACARTGSPPTRIVGLLSPQDIFWADEGKVSLSASQNALIEMSDAPTGNAVTATAGQMTSMFQTNSTALKAIRESSWYARTGAGAYFTAGY